MEKVISEIQIVPVKPSNGLVGFASFVIFQSFYCSSIAIFTRPDGSYRLVYPTKKNREKDMNIFYPINKEIGTHIQEVVIHKYEEVMNKTHDRYSMFNN